MTDTNNSNPRTVVYSNKGLVIKRGYNSLTNEIVWFFSNGPNSTFFNLIELDNILNQLRISKKFSVEISDTSEEV